MDINALVNMTSRAWGLPILAAFHDGVPGRQAPLLVATGASRTAFGQSLDHLIECGLVERNPGYGHPLRPEFRLTSAGDKAARVAHRIYISQKAESATLLRRSWTVPVLATLAEPKHFGTIKSMLPRVTDRALSQSLKSLETTGWIARDIDIDMRPPRPLYQSVDTGRAITEMIAPDMSFVVDNSLGVQS